MEQIPLPHSEECGVTSSLEPSEETPRLPLQPRAASLHLLPSLSCPLLLRLGDFLPHRLLRRLHACCFNVQGVYKRKEREQNMHCQQSSGFRIIFETERNDCWSRSTLVCILRSPTLSIVTKWTPNSHAAGLPVARKSLHWMCLLLKPELVLAGFSVMRRRCLWTDSGCGRGRT